MKDRYFLVFYQDIDRNVGNFTCLGKKMPSQETLLIRAADHNCTLRTSRNVFITGIQELSNQDAIDWLG